MGRSPSTRCRGGWMGPKAGLDGYGEGNPLFPPGFEPQTVQPVAISSVSRPLHK
jgi:hypothetical protein